MDSSLSAHSTAMDSSPSGLLKAFSRTQLRQGEGLVSTLSEDERRALAEELARAGWRRYDRSPTIQRTMSRALSEGSRQFGLSEGSQLHEASWLEQSSSTVGEPATTQALARRTTDLWTPTAADFFAMERPSPAGKSALPESRRAKLNAMKEVRFASAARDAPAPLLHFLPAICSRATQDSRRHRRRARPSPGTNRRWATCPGLRRSGRSRRRTKVRLGASGAWRRWGNDAASMVQAVGVAAGVQVHCKAMHNVTARIAGLR